MSSCSICPTCHIISSLDQPFYCSFSDPAQALFVSVKGCCPKDENNVASFATALSVAKLGHAVALWGAQPAEVSDILGCRAVWGNQDTWLGDMWRFPFSTEPPSLRYLNLINDSPLGPAFTVAARKMTLTRALCQSKALTTEQRLTTRAPGTVLG